MGIEHFKAERDPEQLKRSEKRGERLWVVSRETAKRVGSGRQVAGQSKFRTTTRVGGELLLKLVQVRVRSLQ